MSPEPVNNGWTRWENFVIRKLDNHDDKLEEILCALQKFGSRIAVLEVKAGIWGLLAGILGTIATILIAMALGAFP